MSTDRYLKGLPSYWEMWAYKLWTRCYCVFITPFPFTGVVHHTNVSIKCKDRIDARFRIMNNALQSYREGCNQHPTIVKPLTVEMKKVHAKDGRRQTSLLDLPWSIQIIVFVYFATHFTATALYKRHASISRLIHEQQPSIRWEVCLSSNPTLQPRHN